MTKPRPYGRIRKEKEVPKRERRGGGQRAS